MRKDTAYSLLGGTPATVAHHVGCSRQAVVKWPAKLPRRVADRVLAARVRLEWEVTKAQTPQAQLSPVVIDALSL